MDAKHLLTIPHQAYAASHSQLDVSEPSKLGLPYFLVESRLPLTV